MITSLIVGYALLGGPKGAGAWKQVAVSSSIAVSVPADATTTTGAESAGPGGQSWSFADEKCEYTVCVQPVDADKLAKDPPDVVLADQVMDGLIDLMQPKLKSQRDALFHGWPGLDTVVVQANGSARETRSYLVDKTLYKLVETYTVDGGRPIGSEKFLDSLVVTPAPKDGGLAAAGPVFKKIRPDGAGCEVAMPGTPDQMADKPSKPGEQPSHGIDSQYGNRFYLLAFADVSPDAPGADALRGATLRDFVHRIKADLVSSKTVVRHGSEFLSAQIHVDDMMDGRVDVTTSDTKVYILAMMYPTGHVGSPDIDTFFDGFKVDGAKAPVLASSL